MVLFLTTRIITGVMVIILGTRTITIVTIGMKTVTIR
jgi:hypothetical protein